MWPPVPKSLLFAREAIHPEAWEFLAAHPGEPWCVAVSGGADSVALLILATTLAREHGTAIHVLHFDHRLRGAESGVDAQFVAELSRHLGLPCMSGHWEEPVASATETQAREARLAFFHQAMAGVASRILLTGHHRDDVAETMLLRLARGAGAEGLSAPRPVQRHPTSWRVRPLLNLSKAELKAGLRSNGWSWREDSTNSTTAYPRNRIRHAVLPVWQAASERDVVACAAASRERLQEDDDALHAWLEQLMPGCSWTADTLDLGALRDAPVALWRRALRRWVHSGDLSSQGFAQLLQIAQKGGKASVATGHVVAGGGVLRFAPLARVEPLLPGTLEPGETRILASGASLKFETVEMGEETVQRVMSGGVDPSREAFLAGPIDRLHFRAVEPGDRYVPLGLRGTAKVQDMFVDRKIPLESRSQIPMVHTDDGEIVWIPGFAPAHSRRITPGNRLGVRLTYSS